MKAVTPPTTSAVGTVKGSTVSFASPLVVRVPSSLMATRRWVVRSPARRKVITWPTSYWSVSTITTLAGKMVGVMEPVRTTYAL